MDNPQKIISLVLKTVALGMSVVRIANSGYYESFHSRSGCFWFFIPESNQRIGADAYNFPEDE